MSSDILSDLQARVKSLEDKATALHNRMVLKGVDDLPETVEKIDDELDGINKSVNDLESDLSDLQERVERIERRVGIQEE